MKCKLCRPVLWLREHVHARCIADRPEIQAQFKSWRDAQMDDQALFEDDPQREALEAVIKLSTSDLTAAFPKFLVLAESGSVWSMLWVGWFYQTGFDGATNLVEAESWYHVALQHGSRRARLYLADLYWSQTDFGACERILQPAADEHWVPALYPLAVVKLKQPKTRMRRESARLLLEEAAARGDVGAQWWLGRIMAQGRFGWRRIPRGFSLISDACEKTLALADGNSREGNQQVAGVV